MKNSRVYISYSLQDYEQVSIIRKELESVGLDVSVGEFNQGEDNNKEISYKINSSDYFIIILSDHTGDNKWINYEISESLRDFYYRDVVIIPVLISKIKKPNSLHGFKTFNLYEDFEKDIVQLSSYLKNIIYLDFNLISGYEFESLVTDLLLRSKFKVYNVVDRNRDFGVDIIASSTNRNQLVGSFTTNWIVECKFYKNSRIDLSSIKQLSHQLLTNYPNHNGILITNSLITSTIIETLEIIKKKEKVNIEVIDGRKLKQLLLKYPDLIEEYFIGKGGF